MENKQNQNYDRVKKWREARRKPCPVCGINEVAYNTKQCKQCLYEDNTKDWSKITLSELKSSGNANRGGRYPYIRELSRKSYIKSGLPMRCHVCDYDLHIDICHIHDIKDFSEDTPISVINHLDNLLALCKNHHWEFDHGHLDPFN
jgi:predicted restriction endonuclease